MDAFELKLDKPVKSILIISYPVSQKLILEKRCVERSSEEINAIASLYNATKPLSGISDINDSTILWSNGEEEVTLHSNMTASILNKNQQPDGASNFSHILLEYEEYDYDILITYEDGTEEERTIKHSSHTL
jgi:hypothetical protein